ncbi:MAG: hypothetical protein AUJ49_04970 [Desulfovibrionaceae bacterium CG1_02_65_16]|nr:MAG: hypothetical protein AUJ49_04970 [Desulfovibrionaceae bacterium CG1_02_65_16]
MFLPGDLIFTHGAGLIQRGIRWAERKPGEPESYANHVAGFTGPDQVTEALWSVQTRPFAQFNDGTLFQVWRCMPLTAAQRQAVAAQALAYVGRDYGLLKIGAHLGDALLSRLMGRNVYAVRRLASLDSYPICSWVWSHAYEALGAPNFFGLDPNAADPDDMHDCVSASPSWAMVFELKGAA